MQKHISESRQIKVIKYKFKENNQQIRYSVSQNRQFCFNKLIQHTVSIENIPQNNVLIQNRYIRLDSSFPNQKLIQSHKLQIKDELMPAECIGQVIFSKSKNIPAGSFVFGVFGWQKYYITHEKFAMIIPSPIQSSLDVLSILGSPGVTAYMGLFEIGKIKQGQTIVITDAASFTGLYAVQFAKINKCQVCGIVFNEKQADFLKSKGANHIIILNKNQPQQLQKQLKKIFPKGVDVFFDNIGEEVLDSGLANNKDESRFVLVGSKPIKTYSQRNGQQYKLKNYPRLIIKKNTMQGFCFSDHQQKVQYVIENIQKLLKQKKIEQASAIYHPIKSVHEIPQLWSKIKNFQLSQRVIVTIQDNRKDKQIIPKL